MKHLNITKTYFTATIFLLVSLACRGGVALGDRSQNASGVVENGGTIEVVAKDFSFSLTASQAEPGAITFAVRNDGSMPHDFAIQGNGVDQKTPVIEPGDSAALEVELEPGTYTYLCTIPGHALLGMQGTFTVTSQR